MKRIFSAVAFIVLAAVLCMCLSSCSPRISGTYYLGDKEYSNTYVEMDFGATKVTISQITLGKVSWQTKASYSIKDDMITIVIPDDANALAKVYNGKFTLEQGEDYIKIGAFEYQLSK